MNDQVQHCTRCGRELHPGDEVYLTLDQRTDTYTREGAVPVECDQGGFPFGRDCAKQAVAEHNAKTKAGTRLSSAYAAGRAKARYACGTCGKPIKTGCYCSDVCANADGPYRKPTSR